MNNYILEISNVHKSFGSKKVINNVSLNVNQGEIYGFLGPNGAGKTTLIRMILGLVYPDQGTIKINGYNVKDCFKEAISSVGAIVETPKFYSYLSGYQNLSLIANLHSGIKKDRIKEVLEIVGLSKRSKDKVGTYSLGMKQRLGIARALINYPKLVFLDEPMNGLDPQGMQEMRELIKTLRVKNNITFFITSHLLSEIEQACSQIAVLKEGEIIKQGKIDALLFKDTEIVEVYTEQREKAHSLLSGISYIKSCYPAKDHIVVELEQGCSNKLNNFLITEKVDVKYLIPKKESLENYFINLTQGEN